MNEAESFGPQRTVTESVCSLGFSVWAAVAFGFVEIKDRKESERS